jgi:hypothetical protein
VYVAQHNPAMPMRSLMVPKRSFLSESAVAMSVLFDSFLSCCA